MRKRIQHWQWITVVILMIPVFHFAYNYLSIPSAWISITPNGDFVVLSAKGRMNTLLIGTDYNNYDHPFTIGDNIIGVQELENHIDEKGVHSVLWKDILLFDITNGSMKRIPATDKKGGSNFRASPNGKKLAFLDKDENLTVIAVEDGKVVLRKSDLGFVYGYQNTIGWYSDRLIVLLTGTGSDDYQEEIVLVNIETGGIEKLCDFPNFGSAFDNGLRKAGDTTPLCNGRKEIEALFGKPERQVLTLLPSTDTSGRYYFYERVNDNDIFGTTRWIEGYDTKRHRWFLVKILQWFG
ncbi:MAG: hypothetical protein Greene101449_209 [Candidatus Peregrinibacteria bacterium Greene1014_49]|nr:MAG: hypothetical protein Greene101449_209 [Candidatus Peregrinibacteria bacterium Greene1014_49]